jgi:excisionase family DNA binding protein
MKHPKGPTPGEPARAEPPADSTMIVTLTVAQLRAVVADAVADALADLAPPKDPKLTVSGAEMAHLLGISRASMHKLRTRDGCPALKMGDHFRYQPAAVMAWLEARGTR